jgi:hypothetical protein|tara:strand:+ start:402 stop:767 length:366 start_codon:yes stop_codon:yes gene_type:complete
MSRVKTEIDIEELRKLMALNCTTEEVAAYFGCNKKTIERRMNDDEEFRDAVDSGRNLGRLSIRRQQIRLIEEKDSVAMAIFLGKQLLGQRDQLDSQRTHDKPITIQIVSPYEFDEADEATD